MLIDGEKWACEACVRGHRVSSCHHSDRPLTHINKKGRPVSQCTHCRGLRKSRTTHVKCECGDKKKHCHKNDSDPHHLVDKWDHKQDSRQRCACAHGQRCICALKKEHHLDSVPETGLPPSQPAVLAEPPKKPQLTSTKSESTLTVFRDGHHKPAHKHNDMAHKCGMPYTIPRSHTIHSTSDVTRRSVDHLPLAQPSFLELLPPPPPPRPEQHDNGPQRLTKSENGSPESVPVTNAEDNTNSVTPLELPPFFPPSQPLDNSNDQTPEHVPVTTALGKTPLNQIVTNVPPLDVSSYSSFPATTTSPATCMGFQDTYQDSYFASPDNDTPLGSGAFSAPPVDWSSFPLYSSDVPPTTSTQTPSYASFDYNSMGPSLPAPSSSGDISEVDDFGPLPGLGHSGSDLHDLHSVSEGSDMDNFRISSASSFISLPQAQLLASNNLESMNIDDFLKSANESTAALEHQLQGNIEPPKSLPAQDSYGISQPPEFKTPNPPSSLPMTTSPSDPIWPAALFDSGANMDENIFPSWAQ
ncbi:hypothetical protein ASPWEDRAFT_32646 [Aspergillus wentii DTO 134E9]|uniref:Copper-fist domain-containing protein n=1 Tax=Aspergillus wentii DTO 134E9 TaxID=1073089 RepID=A0A1L9R6D6_ASPWE|nr:uncharacterized protein ASPWEDRAFT_32646 [Aspergillus wentii DTO 134E9]OJJ30470.1 hypothetical protein ASPWEDRAFT_32646 [Aspergillus wentii DTO 134E9]